MNAQLLSIAKAAALLDVTKRTLVQWHVEGRIHLVRLPGKHQQWRITQVELDRLLQPAPAEDAGHE